MTTNLNLTDKETEMLKAVVQEGIDVNCASCAQALKDDNMTWCNANDLRDALGWNKQVIGGVMSSLDAKVLICDTGDSARGARINDWVASDEAIDWFYENNFHIKFS